MNLPRLISSRISFTPDGKYAYKTTVSGTNVDIEVYTYVIDHNAQTISFSLVASKTSAFEVSGSSGIVLEALPIPK